jgi:hypothetical protein
VLRAWLDFDSRKGSLMLWQALLLLCGACSALQERAPCSAAVCCEGADCFAVMHGKLYCLQPPEMLGLLLHVLRDNCQAR